MENFLFIRQDPWSLFLAKDEKVFKGCFHLLFSRRRIGKYPKWRGMCCTRNVRLNRFEFGGANHQHCFQTCLILNRSGNATFTQML